MKWLVFTILFSLAAKPARANFKMEATYSGVTVTSYALSASTQIKQAYAELKNQLSQEGHWPDLKPYVVVVDGSALSQEGAKEVAQIAKDLGQDEVGSLALAKKRKNYGLITMTLVTATITGGATTAALFYGETVNPTTAVTMGLLWGAVSGGYIYHNERFQNWIRKTSVFEQRLTQALRIKSPAVRAHLKATGEWSKYFLHVAGWNAFGALVTAATEGSWQASAATVLAASGAELLASAPIDLAIASDTERLKKKYPKQSAKIQLVSGFGIMLSEIAAQVLSVVAITGAPYEAGIGFAAMSLLGGVYYAKTFTQDYLERRQRYAGETNAIDRCEMLLSR